MAFSMSVYAQEPTTAPTKVSKDELALQKAKTRVAAIETKIAACDSTIAVSTLALDLAQDSIDANEQMRKAIDKDYSQKHKVLLKQTTSKDKAIVTKAKTDIKTLDAAYKATVKENDAAFKAYLRKSDNASRQIAKAEQTKKLTQEKLKEARKTLATANKNMVAKEKAAENIAKGKGRK